MAKQGILCCTPCVLYIAEKQVELIIMTGDVLSAAYRFKMSCTCDTVLQYLHHMALKNQNAVSSRSMQ